MARPKKNQASKDLIVKIRERYKAMSEADRDNREKALEDLKFCFTPGEQWDKLSRTERGDRPCYEFNKIRPTVKRVVNEMRKNRPQGKVRAVEDGDKDTAETLEGLIRNIWNVSDADTVIDYAAEYQVAGGYGAWRVVTEYSSDTAFEQDVFIRAVKNPFCLYADNACADPLKRDARDWTFTDKIPQETFKKKYKDVDVIEFEADEQFDDDEDWADEETVRIAEYWYKEPVTKEIHLLATGESVEEVPEGAQVLRSRTVQTHKIMMCIASGDAILEGPTEWAGSQFPWIVTYGDWLVIDGKIQWSGLVRHAKDAQRSYNYARTAIAETIALAPQAKYLATPKQVAGLEPHWAEAHKKNIPVLLYNTDAAAPGAPIRQGGADVPVALIQESQLASEEIKSVTGIYDASLGNQTNETSGRAITARQAQGEVATFNFADNQGKAIRRTYEILVDIIPKVFDTERAVRVLGNDGAEKYARVNQVKVNPETLQTEVVNDLSKGKFDVAITVGPNYATARQEAAETYTNLIQAMPEAGPLIADLAIKAMDLPYSEEVSERFKAMLPPQIQQMLNQDKPLPPEVMAAMQQAEQVMQQVQQHGQLIEKAAQELEQSKAEDATSKAELEKMLAEIKTQKAELKAMEANFKAEVAEFRAGIAEQDGQRMQDDMGRREQEMTAGANQQGEQTAVQIVQQALQAVTERMDQVEKSIVDRMAVMQPPQPIIVGGGGRRVINFTRDAAGRAVGATMDEVEGA